MMRDRLLRDAALVVMVAVVALGSYTLRDMGWGNTTTIISPGFAGQSTLGSDTPTVAGTAAPLYVVLTPLNWPSPTPQATKRAYATTAPVPDCQPGIAVSGQVCVRYPPSPTASIETPIPMCPTAPATIEVGDRCIWE